MYQSAEVKFNPLISLNAATLTGSYIAFGSFTYPSRIVHIVNDSDENVFISFNGGTTDHLFIKAGTFLLYDFGANKSSSSGTLQLPPTGMVIRGTAGTGTIYCMSATAYTLPSTRAGV